MKNELQERFSRMKSMALRSIAKEMKRDLSMMSESDIDNMIKEFEEKKSKEISNDSVSFY